MRTAVSPSFIDRTPLYAEPQYCAAVKDIKLKNAPAGKIKIEFAICHTKDDTESLFSFVNNISTVEGGYHETGFHNGLLKVFTAAQYCGSA